jgi:hypothetical protein
MSDAVTKACDTFAISATLKESSESWDGVREGAEIGIHSCRINMVGV